MDKYISPDLLSSDVKDNYHKIIDTIKVLVFKENKSLFDALEFDDDYIFSEPLLFAYFNAERKESIAPGMLNEILLGYMKDKNQEYNIEYSFNHYNTSFLPEIGYFKNLSKDKKNITLSTANITNNREVEFEPVLKIDSFEVLKHIHPLLHPYFTEYYRGEDHELTSEYHSNWERHVDSLSKAIEIIKIHLPLFYEMLKLSNRRIYIHDNTKVINFVTIETHGMLYFNSLDINNEIYFIEELIHQGSHNYLNIVLQNKSDFFKIDVEKEMMKDYGGVKGDYRTIYSAFHGLYTVTKRVEYFDVLLTKNLFSGRKKHELLGRLTDQFDRFRTGLEKLDIDKIYTEKGKRFYMYLDNLCETMLSKYRILPELFDPSHRDVDFRYEDFCKLNPIEKFNTFEKENQLIF